MGNFRFGLSFSTYTASCVNVDTTDYPIGNLQQYSNTKRHVKTKSSSNSLFVLDRGATVANSAIAIIDTNFATVTLMGNASTDWGAPTFSTSVTLTRDERTNMYKTYYALPSSFDYRYVGIRLPAGQTITDTNTVYRIGSIFFVSSEVTATKMPTDYEYTAEETVDSEQMQGGWSAEVKLSNQIFEANLSYTPSDSTAVENEFWTLNNVPKTQTILFYEGDTTDKSKVYPVKRRTAVQIKKEPGMIFTPGNITLREV